MSEPKEKFPGRPAPNSNFFYRIEGDLTSLAGIDRNTPIGEAVNQQIGRIAEETWLANGAVDGATVVIPQRQAKLVAIEVKEAARAQTSDYSGETSGDMFPPDQPVFGSEPYTTLRRQQNTRKRRDEEHYGRRGRGIYY